MLLPGTSASSHGLQILFMCLLFQIFYTQLAAGFFMVHRQPTVAIQAVKRPQSDFWKERRVCCISYSKAIFPLVIWVQLIKTMEPQEIISWLCVSKWSYMLNHFSQSPQSFSTSLMWAPVFQSISLNKESALDTEEVCLKVNPPSFTSWETEKTREIITWKHKTELSGCFITLFLYVLSREASNLLDCIWLNQ